MGCRGEMKIIIEFGGIDMKFQYELAGVGWAKVFIEIEGQSHQFYPSYLTNTLDDFLEALLSITPEIKLYEQPPDNITYFRWDEEPAEACGTIELVDKDNIRIQIVWFRDGFEGEEDASGKVVIDSVCNINSFLTEVVKSLDKLLVKHGLLGYQKTWNTNEFPIGKYIFLKHYITTKSEFPIQEIRENGYFEYMESNIRGELMFLSQIVDNSEEVII